MNRPFASEDDFLAAVSQRFPNRHPHLLLARGDDCAVLACPERLAVTTDLFIEDVHFSRKYFTPEEIGYKALAVNVSDAAAMGARPLGFSLGLAGPPGTPAGFWIAVLDGMADLAAEYNLVLTGGDLSACAKLVFSVTLWAEAGPGGRFLSRGKALAGDVLFCVGETGLSAVGLSVLAGQGRHTALRDWPRSCRAHLRPQIRVQAGLALAALPCVRGLMDVSDGLARDLPRFLGNLGAELALAPEQIEPEVARLAETLGQDPAELAVVGGEDYALLGACAPGDFSLVAAAVPQVRPIGLATRTPGLTLNGRPLTVAGFDHFSTGQPAHRAG